MADLSLPAELMVHAHAARALADRATSHSQQLEDRGEWSEAVEWLQFADQARAHADYCVQVALRREAG